MIKFYTGLANDLSNKPYEEGALYFAFPDNTGTLGHVYLDMDNTRKEISSSYNDSNILLRLNELERVALIRCTSIETELNEITLRPNGGTILSAYYLPADATDEVIWTSDDPSICSIINTSTNNNGTSTATLQGGTGEGTCTITARCGNYSATCNVILQAGELIEHILVENFACNRDSFIYTAPISLEDGQYIEASIDTSGVTQIKQNLLSFGQNIDVSGGSGTGFRIHVYTSATAARVQSYARLFLVANNQNQSGIETPVANPGSILLRLDKAGLWIDGTLFTPPDNAQAIYTTIINGFRNLTSFSVGSAEGTTRSTAYYNYIKYYEYVDE